MADQMTTPDPTLAARLDAMLEPALQYDSVQDEFHGALDTALRSGQLITLADHQRAVQDAVAKAGYNPRYILYAHDNGRSAQDQIEIDKAAPGAPMSQFVAWMGRCLALFRTVSPQSFTASGLKDAASFDAWLERYGAPVPCDYTDLLNRADITAAMLRMGEKTSFGTDAALIEELAAAIRSRGVAG